MKQQSYSKSYENYESNDLLKDLSLQNMEQEKKIYTFESIEPEENKNLQMTPKPKRGRHPQIKGTQSQQEDKKYIKNKDKKIKFGTAQKQKNPNQQFGHWSLQENKRYHWFLEIFHSHFMNRSLRRMDRIFTSMAKFVGTRQAEQCRSHHQKMQKKHHTFTKILFSLRLQHYQTASVVDLKQDMQKNQVRYEQEILTQQLLIKYQNMRQIQGDQNPQKIQPQIEALEPDHTQNIDLMNDIGPLQIQSSKNYFKMQEVEQRNNILDDAYEKNFNFQQFF